MFSAAHRVKEAHMSLTLFTVVVDCKEPGRQADFWSEALSYEVRERNTDEFLVSDPAGVAFPLYFMKVPEPKVGKNRWHVDLLTAGGMSDEVDRLVELGARLVEVRQDPDTLDNPDTWSVLEDPEGNVFCVTSEQTRTGWA
jgi:Glyoxalase-like domain